MSSAVHIVAKLYSPTFREGVRGRVIKAPTPTLPRNGGGSKKKSSPSLREGVRGRGGN